MNVKGDFMAPGASFCRAFDGPRSLLHNIYTVIFNLRSKNWDAALAYYVYIYMYVSYFIFIICLSNDLLNLFKL